LCYMALGMSSAITSATSFTATSSSKYTGLGSAGRRIGDHVTPSRHILLDQKASKS
jgi:hypothetical protein